MYKITETYTDYDDNQRTEDFYFNYSEAELTDLQFSVPGGLAGMIDKIIKTNDMPKLVELLKELVKIKDLKWIRLHYLYPELVSKELLELISSSPKICKYVDIPLQHIDDKILKEMNRRSREDEIRNLIKEIKDLPNNISIRSTFIVGFPGETRKQFNKLCEFLKEAQLDNVGFFSYSREENTKAFYMKRQVPEFIKKRRLKKVQKIVIF